MQTYSYPDATEGAEHTEAGTAARIGPGCPGSPLALRARGSWKPWEIQVLPSCPLSLEGCVPSDEQVPAWEGTQQRW